MIKLLTIQNKTCCSRFQTIRMYELFWHIFTYVKNKFHSIITITPINKFEIHQKDVKKAFLKSELDNEVYMEQSERFVING
jgi:hypothetical protein